MQTFACIFFSTLAYTLARMLTGVCTHELLPLKA